MSKSEEVSALSVVTWKSSASLTPHVHILEIALGDGGLSLAPGVIPCVRKAKKLKSPGVGCVCGLYLQKRSCVGNSTLGSFPREEVAFPPVPCVPTSHFHIESSAYFRGLRGNPSLLRTSTMSEFPWAIFSP